MMRTILHAFISLSNIAVATNRNAVSINLLKSTIASAFIPRWFPKTVLSTFNAISYVFIIISIPLMA